MQGFISLAYGLWPPPRLPCKHSILITLSKGILYLLLDTYVPKTCPRPWMEKITHVSFGMLLRLTNVEWSSCLSTVTVVHHGAVVEMIELHRLHPSLFLKSKKLGFAGHILICEYV
jgi:hypothetical protein